MDYKMGIAIPEIVVSSDAEAYAIIKAAMGNKLPSNLEPSHYVENKTRDSFYHNIKSRILRQKQ